MFPTYTISELAKEFGISTRAIRFYEDQGLLNPRREGQSRIYSKRDYVRLKLTLRGKRLGFTLGQVREFFELYDSAKDEKPQLIKFLHSLDNRRKLLEQQREDIEVVLSEIGALEDECRSVLEHLDRTEGTQPRESAAAGG